MTNKNNKIIFHYPGPFYDVLDTGEKKRPKKMFDAFCELGYDVYPVIGNVKARREKIDRIKKEIKEFTFIYSENSTLPLKLCSKNHYPLLDSPDYELFRIAWENSINIGVFYRDIFWRYSEYKKQIGLLKYSLALPFYKSEIKLYSRYAKRIFIPSKRMKILMPNYSNSKTYLLPPGEELHPPKICSDNNKKSNINLIYVGSISPPKYNLSILIDKLRKVDRNKINLTLITRNDEYQKYKNYYNFPECVSIKVASGKELISHYKKADIAVLYFTNDDYMKLAMPQKFFEAIGFGLPIISYGDTAATDFVKENDIGWCVKENENIFEYLIKNPEEIEKKRKNVLKIQAEHTWKARAKEVASVLMVDS